MSERKQYSDEFKLEAIRLQENSSSGYLGNVQPLIVGVGGPVGSGKITLIE